MRLLLCFVVLLIAGCASDTEKLTRTFRPEKVILKESITYTFPENAEKPVYRYTLPAGTYQYYIRDGGTWIYLHMDETPFVRISLKNSERLERPAALVLYRNYNYIVSACVSPVADFLKDGMGELAWMTAKKKSDKRIMLHWAPLSDSLKAGFTFEGEGSLD